MEKPGFYAILPSPVRYDRRLSASEKVFFAEITALSDQCGYCYAGNGYFSNLYDTSDRTVQRWVKHLQELGYVAVTNVRDGAAMQRRISPLSASVPDVCAENVPDKNVGERHPVSAGDKNVAPTPTKMSPIPRQKCRLEQYKNNNTRENNTRAGARGFDRFWAAYPRKVGKGAAERSFERIRPDAALLDGMLRAIESQRQSDTWQRGYIPNPATWLNQRRWEDEPDGVTAPAAQQTPHSPPPPTPVLDPNGDITKLWGAWEE